MIILIIIISLILCGISIFGMSKSYEFEELFTGIFMIFGVTFLISVIALLILLCAYPYNIDAKLKMYQEENQSIEEKIKTTVQNYKEYEQDTFSKIVEKADLQTLILKFPELNSNELVKSEIETYKSNNEKIKSLKEQQIDRGLIGWWLFFNIGVNNE